MMTMESEAAGKATLNALDDDNHNGDEYHWRAKITKKKILTSKMEMNITGGQR